MPWGFYGREGESAQIRSILGRGRWFFAVLHLQARMARLVLMHRA